MNEDPSLAPRDDTTRQRELTQKLIASGVLIPTGIRGVFGRNAVYLRVISGLESSLDKLCGGDEPERVFFPPVTPRETLRLTGYMENFPTLCGSVHAFDGSDEEHGRLMERIEEGGDWGGHLGQTEVCLTPAACFPLYPTVRGKLPDGGRLFDFTAFCFRREPSDDPVRMQTFQVRENVRLGSPEQVDEWRNIWTERGLEFIRELGLPVELALASDPFFGRGGRMMKASQVAQELKFELLVPITSERKPTAVGSFNYHHEHFASVFGILQANGTLAHSACLGFGLDRIALALFHHHGTAPEDWPEGVRQRLLT